jgi:phenylacetate-CoA ligase
MFSFIRKRQLYERMPTLLKQLTMLIPFSFWAGKAYRLVMKRAAAVEQWGREEIEQYQAQRLAEILTFACDQVPAYGRYQRYLKLRPHEAINAFPLLSKAELMANLPDYLPRHFAQIPHYACSTGGTSGNQLNFYLDNDSPAIEMAFMHRQWARVGYTSRTRKATLRGFEFPHADAGVYWQLNPIYNELQLSPFHLNAQTFPRYLEQLHRYRPEFLHGYPSAISILAGYVGQTSASIQGIRAVLLGSEALDSAQRAHIEKVFQARAYSWYGHSERLILAGECEKTTTYHQFPDYGFLEILSDQGEVVDYGVKGELVGTGFWNRSLPLIRYRTEDQARRLEPHCPCGRIFDRFDEVEGRWRQEYVIGKNLSKISPAALNIHGACFDHVSRYQYHQNRAGILNLRLMVTANFTAIDEQMIRQAYQNKVGAELEVNLIIVEEIPLTPRGKLKRLIQEIPTESNSTPEE